MRKKRDKYSIKNKLIKIGKNIKNIKHKKCNKIIHNKKNIYKIKTKIFRNSK